MIRRITPWAASLVLLACGPGIVHVQAGPAPAAKAASRFLKPGELDASLIVPPPPAAGSPEAAAEIAELRALETTRTPQRLARAQHDAATENFTAIAEIFGPLIKLDRLPATARLFADLRIEDGLAAKAAKNFFRRPRPWEVDATLAADPAQADCDKGEPESSYPSGHAMMGYTAAGVLAQLMPGNAQFILKRASDYAESRLICSVHYRRDTEASHVLATALIAKLMTKPEFQAEFEAARAELTAAHIAP